MTDTSAPTINAKTFRFKFSNDVCDALMVFSQQHKFDSKEDFKENWDVWTSDYSDVIQNERNRLEQIGYKGKIIDKMYKSVRYYYCKKHTSREQPQEKRRKYISKNKEFIDLIDGFIKRQCVEDEATKSILCTLKPSQGWDMFNKDCVQAINDEINRILSLNDTMTKEDALSKIHKTFNNRYFIKIRTKKYNIK